MQKILIISPYGIGDVLFTMPVLKNLRLAYPKVEITYLCNTRCAEFLRHNEDINKVLVYDRDDFVATYRQNWFAFQKKWYTFIKNVRTEHFDVSLDFSFNSLFGFLAWAGGIQRRLGFNYCGRGHWLTERIEFKGFEDRHVADYFLDILAFMDVSVQERKMSLSIPLAEIQWAQAWLIQHRKSPRKHLIAVFPGGGASWGKNAYYKLWDIKKYAQLVDKIIENYDADIILMGDKNDASFCKEIFDMPFPRPLINAMGETRILQLAALMRQCDVVISNDAGSVHVAIAAGARVLSIYGPVDPRVYGPYPSESKYFVQKGLACQPCYRRFRMPACSHLSCLRELSVEEVYRKVQGII